MMRLPAPAAVARAPERAILFVLAATLDAAQQALRCEHPTLPTLYEDGDPPPTLRLAATLMELTSRLRRHLDLYEEALVRASEPANEEQRTHPF